MYFFTADTHIGHDNIISHCNRPFENEIEMTSEIINRHIFVEKLHFSQTEFEEL